MQMRNIFIYAVLQSLDIFTTGIGKALYFIESNPVFTMAGKLIMLIVSLCVFIIGDSKAKIPTSRAVGILNVILGLVVANNAIIIISDSL